MADSAPSVVSEHALRSAVTSVLTVPNQQPPPFDLDTPLETLKLDSLSIAEVIVLLEESTSMLLELAADRPLRTLDDLRCALRPIVPVP